MLYVLLAVCAVVCALCVLRLSRSHVRSTDEYTSEEELYINWSMYHAYMVDRAEDVR